MNNNAHSSKISVSALRMSYYADDLDWMGGPPPFDGPMLPPPPGYGRGMRPGGQQGDYAGVITGSGGPYGANQMNPNYYRRGGGSSVRRGGISSTSVGGGARPGGNGGGGGGLGMGGQRGMMMGGGMMPGVGVAGGVDPFVYPDALRNAQGPYFGRDNAFGRMSLKDMAQRSTQSFDAEVIKSMNNRANSRRAELGGGGGGGSSFPVEAGGERRGTTTSTTSTSSQYVPLSSIYGPRSSPPIMDRSPPLNGGPAPPTPMLPIIEANAMVMGDLPQSVQTARSVRPSVVLVTSEGVRKENSQGSGFVVAFDDSAMEDQDDDDDVMKDRVFILTSAHVAPPGWKVSVTFPGDPDKQYPATVVGRKLSSDLALLCVETVVDDNDDYPFPPPLVLTNEDVSTDTNRANDDRVPTSEIGSPVFSFGYPMGVEGPTMTSGILSATTKGINYMDAPTGEEPSEISKSRPFEKTMFVITDAAMAGGMSGGPLVNSEGIVLAINALVRPDLRALGNYAVSALECETFLEKLEDKRSKDAGGSGTSKRGRNNNDDNSDRSSRRNNGRTGGEPQRSATSTEEDSGVAGFRVMLYGYSCDKSEAAKILRRVAGLDELRAENAMRSAHSFGAGVVDEFYVAESGGRERAVKAARKSADDLLEKLEKEGMMVEVEPLKLLK